MPASLPARPNKLPLPNGVAWLHRYLPKAHFVGGYIHGIMHDPAYRDILSSDYRYGRVLRPLCHMLGLRPSQMPDFMQRPRRKRVSKPKPPKPANEPFIPRAWLPPKRAKNPPVWNPPAEPQSHDPPVYRIRPNMGWR